jgi:hypothetical protein
MPPEPPVSGFHMIVPPEGYDPSDPSTLQRVPLRDPPPAVPLPIEFVFPGTTAAPTVRSIEAALRRHRLLFLWLAHPSHVHVPLDLTPGKEHLYDLMGLDLAAPPQRLAVDAILRYEEPIDRWLAEQQRALGAGPMGRPLRSVVGQYPVPAYALWRLDEPRHTPMVESYRAVARSVGAALSAPRPAWIDDRDVGTIRRCAGLARPRVISDWGDDWEDCPSVSWDYPDRLQEAIGKLAPMSAIEAGSLGQSLPPPVPTLPAARSVVLRGLGAKPLVLGEEVPQLSDARYDLVDRLLVAGDAGLSKDQLERKSSGARRTLKSLADSHPNWARVIQFPGTAGNRYRFVDQPPD